MNQPGRFYRERLEVLGTQAQQLKKQLAGLAVLRVFAFLLALLGLYYGTTNHWGFTLAGFGCLVLFFFAVSRNADIRYQYEKVKELLTLNTLEQKAQELEFEDFPDGSDYKVPGHPFSEDLDLFGPHSFFQYLNRTGLKEGEACLAGRLGSNEAEGIPDLQHATSDLAPRVEWRQDFYATARLSDVDLPLERILNWLEGYRPYVPGMIRWAAPVFAALSVLAWTGYAFGIWAVWGPVLLFSVGLGVSAIYLGKTQALSEKASKVRTTFVAYQRLLALIEGERFNATLLMAYQKGLQTEGRPLSEVLMQFTRRLQALEHRNNLLIGLLGNGLFLMDLSAAKGTETWIASYAPSLRQWFHIIAEFDAVGSLGNFAFNHPEFEVPEILTTGETVLEIQGLAHPLLPRDIRVANDFSIQDGMFYIITGANMAGKSTFLRSLTLSMVMARCGLPVCAKSMRYRPLPLITSMRTEDSLARNESYFFAELKRLKQLVGALEAGPHFVLLDEILKGTNSKDKARGSRLFLERLVNSGATGLIATHDLSLCEAADAMEQVQNFYFDAEIREGELFFDYKLRPGICSNMNASFLLRKMGIIRD